MAETAEMVEMVETLKNEVPFIIIPNNAPHLVSPAE